MHHQPSRHNVRGINNLGADNGVTMITAATASAAPAASAFAQCNYRCRSAVLRRIFPPSSMHTLHYFLFRHAGTHYANVNAAIPSSSSRSSLSQHQLLTRPDDPPEYHHLLMHTVVVEMSVVAKEYQENLAKLREGTARTAGSSNARAAHTASTSAAAAATTAHAFDHVEMSTWLNVPPCPAMNPCDSALSASAAAASSSSATVSSTRTSLGMRTLLLDTISTLLRFPPNTSILTLGYTHLDNGRNRSGIGTRYLHNTDTNTTITHLQSAAWYLLLTRINNDDLMLWLLTQTCLFIQIDNGNLVQVCGPAVGKVNKMVLLQRKAMGEMLEGKKKSKKRKGKETKPLASAPHLPTPAASSTPSLLVRSSSLPPVPTASSVRPPLSHATSSFLAYNTAASPSSSSILLPPPLPTSKVTPSKSSRPLRRPRSRISIKYTSLMTPLPRSTMFYHAPTRGEIGLPKIHPFQVCKTNKNGAIRLITVIFGLTAEPRRTDAPTTNAPASPSRRLRRSVSNPTTASPIRPKVLAAEVLHARASSDAVESSAISSRRNNPITALNMPQYLPTNALLAAQASNLAPLDDIASSLDFLPPSESFPAPAPALASATSTTIASQTTSNNPPTNKKKRIRVKTDARKEKRKLQLLARIGGDASVDVQNVNVQLYDHELEEQKESDMTNIPSVAQENVIVHDMNATTHTVSTSTAAPSLKVDAAAVQPQFTIAPAVTSFSSSPLLIHPLPSRLRPLIPLLISLLKRHKKCYYGRYLHECCPWRLPETKQEVDEKRRKEKVKKVDEMKVNEMKDKEQEQDEYKMDIDADSSKEKKSSGDPIPQPKPIETNLIPLPPHSHLPNSAPSSITLTFPSSSAASVSSPLQLTPASTSKPKPLSQQSRSTTTPRSDRSVHSMSASSDEKQALNKKKRGFYLTQSFEDEDDGVDEPTSNNTNKRLKPTSLALPSQHSNSPGSVSQLFQPPSLPPHPYQVADVASSAVVNSAIPLLPSSQHSDNAASVTGVSIAVSIHSTQSTDSSAVALLQKLQDGSPMVDVSAALAVPSPQIPTTQPPPTINHVSIGCDPYSQLSFVSHLSNLSKSQRRRQKKMALAKMKRWRKVNRASKQTQTPSKRVQLIHDSFRGGIFATHQIAASQSSQSLRPSKLRTASTPPSDFIPLSHLPLSTLLQMSTPTSSVISFLQRICDHLLPRALFGSATSNNYHRFIWNITRFVKLRRFETITMRELMEGMKVSEVEWLKMEIVKSAKVERKKSKADVATSVPATSAVQTDSVMTHAMPSSQPHILPRDKPRTTATKAHKRKIDILGDMQSIAQVAAASTSGCVATAMVDLCPVVTTAAAIVATSVKKKRKSKKRGPNRRHRGAAKKAAVVLAVRSSTVPPSTLAAPAADGSSSAQPVIPAAVSATKKTPTKRTKGDAVNVVTATKQQLAQQSSKKQNPCLMKRSVLKIPKRRSSRRTTTIMKSSSFSTSQHQHYPPSHHHTQLLLFTTFLRYIYTDFLLPLLRTNFYATDTEWSKHRIVFYRREVWNEVIRKSMERMSGLNQEVEDGVMNDVAVSTSASAPPPPATQSSSLSLSLPPPPTPDTDRSMFVRLEKQAAVEYLSRRLEGVTSMTNVPIMPNQMSVKAATNNQTMMNNNPATTSTTSTLSLTHTPSTLAGHGLGVATLRLRPRKNGHCRPIVNMARGGVVRMNSNGSVGTASTTPQQPQQQPSSSATLLQYPPINTVLRHIFEVIRYEKEEHALLMEDIVSGGSKKNGNAAGAAASVTSKPTAAASPSSSMLPSVPSNTRRKSRNLLGCSVFGVDSIYSRILTFSQQWRNLKPINVASSSSSNQHAPLYAVCVDIKHCFDTIDRVRLHSLIISILAEPSYSLSRYTSLMYVNSVVRTKYLRSISPAVSLPMFLHVCIAKSKAQFNAVYTDSVSRRFMTTKNILATLYEHLTQNLVRIGGVFYHQTEGIPQGSVLSAVLCGIYLAQVEKKEILPRVLKSGKKEMEERIMKVKLETKKNSSTVSGTSIVNTSKKRTRDIRHTERKEEPVEKRDKRRKLVQDSTMPPYTSGIDPLPTTASSPSSPSPPLHYPPHHLLLRQMDDFFFVTTSLSSAKDFHRIMTRGFKKEYGVEINTSKTQVWFGEEEEQKEPTSSLEGTITRTMTWNGYQIDIPTLSVQADYSRIRTREDGERKEKKSQKNKKLNELIVEGETPGAAASAPPFSSSTSLPRLDHPCLLDTLTIDTTHNRGLSLSRAFRRALHSRLHPLLLSKELHSFEGVCKNLYLNFVAATMKLITHESYLTKSKTSNSHTREKITNEWFLLRVLFDGMIYSKKIVDGRFRRIQDTATAAAGSKNGTSPAAAAAAATASSTSISVHFLLTPLQFTFLTLSAFLLVFTRKQTRYHSLWLILGRLTSVRGEPWLGRFDEMMDGKNQGSLISMNGKMKYIASSSPSWLSCLQRAMSSLRLIEATKKLRAKQQQSPRNIKQTYPNKEKLQQQKSAKTPVAMAHASASTSITTTSFATTGANSSSFSSSACICGTTHISPFSQPSFLDHRQLVVLRATLSSACEPSAHEIMQGTRF